MRIFKVKREKIVVIKKPVLDQRAKEEFAQKLRDNPTGSELAFCHLLDKCQIKYEFQPVMLGYIPDFYFPDHGGRIIEIDGSSHNGREDYDRHRDKVFRKHGYRTLRIRAVRVFRNSTAVTNQVLRFLRLAPDAAPPVHRKKPPRPKKSKADRQDRQQRRGVMNDSSYKDFLRATEGL